MILSDPAGAPVDSFLELLFMIAAKEADSADLLANESRWLRRDRAAGVPVDVLLGPAVPPSFRASVPPTATAAAPGETAAGPTPTRAGQPSLAMLGSTVRYWLDGESRLHRLETRLGAGLPMTVDFRRGDRPALSAIDLLGGRAIAPRPVTRAEADTLARLGQRNRAARGGEITLIVPTLDGTLQRAVGWLDWRNAVGYLAVRDLDRPDGEVLRRAGRAGVASLVIPVREPGTGEEGLPPLPPPLPPPRKTTWRFATWEQLRNERDDVDLLVGEALFQAGTRPADADELRSFARWLRTDAIDGDPVTVYEMPEPAERNTPAGQARLRYWVDASGVLRRLEVRARSGGFARLDVVPAAVPYVRPVPT